MSNWTRIRVLALLAAAGLPAAGQEFRAGISGFVRDSQGAAMPRIAVVAQNLATNDVSKTATNTSGYYSFPVLPIGTYRVTAEASGFKKSVRDNLELRVGD